MSQASLTTPRYSATNGEFRQSGGSAAAVKAVSKAPFTSVTFAGRGIFNVPGDFALGNNAPAFMLGPAAPVHRAANSYESAHGANWVYCPVDYKFKRVWTMISEGAYQSMRDDVQGAQVPGVPDPLDRAFIDIFIIQPGQDGLELENQGDMVPAALTQELVPSRDNWIPVGLPATDPYGRPVTPGQSATYNVGTYLSSDVLEPSDDDVIPAGSFLGVAWRNQDNQTNGFWRGNQEGVGVANTDWNSVVVAVQIDLIPDVSSEAVLFAPLSTRRRSAKGLITQQGTTTTSTSQIDGVVSLFFGLMGEPKAVRDDGGGPVQSYDAMLTPFNSRNIDITTYDGHGDAWIEATTDYRVSGMTVTISKELHTNLLLSPDVPATLDLWIIDRATVPPYSPVEQLEFRVEDFVPLIVDYQDEVCDPYGNTKASDGTYLLNLRLAFANGIVEIAENQFVGIGLRDSTNAIFDGTGQFRQLSVQLDLTPL